LLIKCGGGLAHVVVVFVVDTLLAYGINDVGGGMS